LNYLPCWVIALGGQFFLVTPSGCTLILNVKIICSPRHHFLAIYGSDTFSNTWINSDRSFLNLAVYVIIVILTDTVVLNSSSIVESCILVTAWLTTVDPWRIISKCAEVTSFTHKNRKQFLALMTTYIIQNKMPMNHIAHLSIT
jgi:hypothetical protein